MATIPLARPDRTTTGTRPDRFSIPVARGLVAAGVVLIAGTLLDLGVLWVAQRDPTAQWEFVAVARTLDAFPPLVLGVGLLYGAQHVRASTTLWAYRLLALALIVLALAGAALGALMATDYLALAGSVRETGLRVFRSTAFKAIALAAVYTVVLLPIGLLGLRRPRPD